MKSFLTQFVLLISIIACTHQEDGTVYNNYIFGPYDTLVYKSMQTNDLDSFVVNSISRKVYVIDGYYNEEHLIIGCKNINILVIDSTFIYINRTSEYFMLAMQNRNFFHSYDYKSFSSATNRFGNKVKNEVFIVTDSSQAVNETDIVSLHYCDIYGVIRYDQKNGEAFELQLHE